MKPGLYLCIKNPFSQRDLERMGIVFLEQHFDLHILDCTAWLMPKAYRTRGTAGMAYPGLRTVHSLAEFKSELNDGGYAVDYVGQFCPQAILMFEALRARDIKLVVLDSGAYPTPEITLGKRSILTKFLNAFQHGGLRQHIDARINWLLLKWLPDQRPDYALISGNWWKNDPRFARARYQIPAHSFDYEAFRALRDVPPDADISVIGPYAVYLDEDIAGHEDNEEMGMQTPATEKRFYPALARIFDTYEQVTGRRVVIAGYPSQRAGTLQRFGQRPVYFGRTAELIRNSQLVFAHASTAISFAVLWRRPLLFITSDEIAGSWYQPWVDAPRALLRADMINIDRQSTADQLSPSTAEVAYEAYEHSFIKAADSPDLPLWEIFLKVKERFAS